MLSQESQEIARQAIGIYEHRLKATLEQSNPNDFVAIEPVSGEYFVGTTLSEAIGAARRAHPHRVAYALRIGHHATVHLGTSSR
jgi:hypothetical protein